MERTEYPGELYESSEHNNDEFPSETDGLQKSSIPETMRFELSDTVNAGESALFGDAGESSSIKESSKKRKETQDSDSSDAFPYDLCNYDVLELRRNPRRFTLPPTPIPSDHMFDNLDTLRRNYCRNLFPQNLGVPLTEEALVGALIKNPYGDLEMILPGNQIYPGFLEHRINDEDIPTIINVLLEIRGITIVNLCYNDITDKGIQILAPALQECANITEVNLMHNNITADGILSLCRALMHRSPLHSLKLTGMKFGDKGMTALTCLILTGRGPYDLDIGECDLSVEGFQTICSALHAMDHDIDYPSFLLLKNHLPMELVGLKESKALYNEEVAHITALNRKISQPTFVRVGGGGGGRGDQPDYHSHNRHSLYPPAATCTLAKQSGLEELFETFSATILQGLFDLRHRFSEDDISPLTNANIASSSVLNDPYYTLKESADMVLTNVDNMIENFNRLRTGAGADRTDENLINELVADDDIDTDVAEGDPTLGSPSISKSMPIKEAELVHPSLYALEIVDEEFLGPKFSLTTQPLPTDNPESEFEDNVAVDMEQQLDEMSRPPDSYTAEAAATHVVRDAIFTASKKVGGSEYKDGSDITQLILTAVLETMETIRNTDNLTEDDCDRVLEDAVEKTCRFIFPKLSPNCTLKPDDVSCFFKVLFRISQGTFFQLFENSFFVQALMETGNSACAKEHDEEVKLIKDDTNMKMQQKHGAMSEQQIRRIAISYLQGIFLEAARVVGVAKPFGVEVEDNSGNDLAGTELKIQDTLDSFMSAAGAFAAVTKVKADKIEDTNFDFKSAADSFVIDLFENVNNMVVETDIKQKVIEMENENSKGGGPVTYAHVSRPTRLVLNRPMFGPHSEIMGTKLGDYVGQNSSIKELHIQKWNLNEDGMVKFMEFFMPNTTLVTLDLGCNQLGADGMALLGRYLTGNTNLKHLILSNNRIRDAGMAQLNKGIPQSALVSLDISNNGITYREIDPLLATLPSSRVRALYMWGNHFGVDSWNILKLLYEEEILSTNYTDVVLQRVDDEKVVVKNMQIRTTNEYYEVPAISDYGLRLPPSFIDDSCKMRNRAHSSVTDLTNN